MKAEEGEAAEGKYEASGVWLIKFKKTSCFHNINVQSEAASYPENLGKMTNKGGYTENNRFSM